MYIPKDFKNENKEEVQQFLIENSFGILINQKSGALSATHIPMLLDKDDYGNDTLVGHISRENTQWKSFNDTDQVLAVFNGPNSYISSSWYKKENIPTYNYIAVHVYGTIKIIEGEALHLSLKKLIDKFEVNSQNPVKLENMSPDLLKQMKYIVGFTIQITSIQPAYKLSQNRHKEDYDTIIQKLENQEDNGSKEVAKVMKKLKK